MFLTMGWMHFMPIKKVERFFVRDWFPPSYVPLISIRTVLNTSRALNTKNVGTNQLILRTLPPPL
jgi:hypothetical protein